MEKSENGTRSKHSFTESRYQLKTALGFLTKPFDLWICAFHPFPHPECRAVYWSRIFVYACDLVRNPFTLHKSFTKCCMNQVRDFPCTSCTEKMGF